MGEDDALMVRLRPEFAAHTASVIRPLTRAEIEARAAAARADEIECPACQRRVRPEAFGWRDRREVIPAPVCVYCLRAGGSLRLTAMRLSPADEVRMRTLAALTGTLEWLAKNRGWACQAI